jgi:UDP-MurNAc hydroxylase
MKFSILSHACLYVEHGGSALMVDPWLLGSAYWRSWWNFPPVDTELVKQLRPTHIFITHIHWDHFHGPSLRHFGKDTPILIPRDRYNRMGRDLASMGFRNVTQIPHAKDFELPGGLVIRPYTFLPFTDTALMIRSCDTTILDANDCKIVGLPLQQILSDFPHIDFALRSHSSANVRVCHHYIGEPGEPMDDREHYLRSFCNFMRAVRPRYAVPFASNHCHLHRDTIHLNAYIQTPLDVAAHFERFREQHELPTQLELMLPGSSWSEDTGFHLVGTSIFAQRNSSLKRYLDEKSATLESYYLVEQKVRVTTEDMQRFFGQFFQAVPWLARLPFKGKPILMVCEGGAAPASWWIDVWTKRVWEGAAEDEPRARMRIHIPAIVLRQSLRVNMFGQAGISKRVRYLATRIDMKRLRLFEFLLEMYEVELLPVRANFSPRSLQAWMRRWREPLLYLQLILWVASGHKLIDFEQHLLERTGDRRSAAQLRTSQSAAS